MFYHVTPARNLRGILRDGLLPRLGPRSRQCREPRKAIYVFPDLDAVEAALESWMIQAFGEEARLALLEVRMPPDLDIHSDAAFERHVHGPIPPDGLRVLSRDVFEEIDLQHL